MNIYSIWIWKDNYSSDLKIKAYPTWKQWCLDASASSDVWYQFHSVLSLSWWPPPQLGIYLRKQLPVLRCPATAAQKSPQTELPMYLTIIKHHPLLWQPIPAFWQVVIRCSVECSQHAKGYIKRRFYFKIHFLPVLPLAVSLTDKNKQNREMGPLKPNSAFGACPSLFSISQLANLKTNESSFRIPDALSSSFLKA